MDSYLDGPTERSRAFMQEAIAFDGGGNAVNSIWQTIELELAIRADLCCLAILRTVGCNCCSHISRDMLRIHQDKLATERVRRLEADVTQIDLITVSFRLTLNQITAHTPGG
jgi:hypothetical protein